MRRHSISAGIRRGLAIVGLAIVGLASLVACGRSRSSADSTAAGSTADARRVAVRGQFDAPESVRYDSELDTYYVSNIGGDPMAHDGNGWIARVSAVDPTAPDAMNRLAEGGKNGIRLDAPKGIAVVADTLWVADIDTLRAINKRTGARIADVAPPGATFLNDVAVGPLGVIYVTDTGLGADAKHPGVGRIFRVMGRTVTEVARGDELAQPNGIAWDAARERFILAPLGGKAVQSWDRLAAAPKTLATGPGQYDGVDVLPDGRIVVSSWADSTVSVVDNGKLRPIVRHISSPADFGVDTRRNVLAIPRLEKGVVEFWKVR